MGFQKEVKLGYKQLKDLSFEIFTTKDKFFTVCFWIYLPKFTPFPCTILHQLPSGNPFLALGKDKKLIFSPTFLSKAVTCVISEMEFPLEEWVHLGCEVSRNVIRIHINGKILGEKRLDSLPTVESTKMTLSAAREGFDNLDGYAYSADLLPSTSSIHNHFVKDPPLRLCIGSSSVSEVESENDGTWNIVGGKVSCRKHFSLDILLLNAFGEPAHKELEVVASLIYADDRSPVENAEDDEAPLLTICDGLEFPSVDKPSRFFQGRASLKLNVSQLSSECDNKLFCIKLSVPEMENYPYFEVFTPPILSISRSSNGKIPTITWKKLPSGVHLFNGSSSPQCGVGNSELQQKAACESRPNLPPLKRVKFGQITPMENTKADTSVKHHEEECDSYRMPENKVTSATGTSLASIQENYGSMDNSTSDSESADARNSESKNMPCDIDLLSDLTIFRYCLGSLSERLAMLKEISVAFSESDISDMAEKVAFFSGCTHHRHQITIAKRLLEEGAKVWNSISRGSHRVQWDDVVFNIEEQFMRIACCNTRSLTQQDLNFLRRTSGGREYMTKDNFHKMWCWLYPVAFTISRPEINSLWASTSPKWIEGFVTKEEVEYALQSLSGISQPGTFILRFPTTRTWPHPDAGSLVVSYVATDFSLHHRQLSLDYSSVMFESNRKPLEELLLSEPELSRVGRMPVD
ncbi:hypothetical protein vseg_007598 [Gypsophila vaccaria]